LTGLLLGSVSRACQHLHEAEVAARPVIIHGRAPDVLVRHSTHADLLVVGSRGHKPLTNLLLGSTSEYCAQHAECPVMIIRRRTHRRRTTEGVS
jgi:nucleotide-binding universal stress UspA family protein